MIYKTTAGFLCLCIMCSGLLAACSKKSADDDLQKQSVQNPETSNAADNKTHDETPEQIDILTAESMKALAEKSESKSVDIKRSHTNHGYQYLEPKTSGIDQNPILKEIPGDSFLILASNGNFNLEREDIGDFFKHIAALMLHHVKNIPKDTPFQKSTQAFAQAIFKTFSPQKLTSLGIAGDVSPQFALYFVRQTPVMRIALSDAQKFRDIIESYWEQNDVETHRADNVSSHWILVPVDNSSSAELALRWESDRLTITMISSMEHAGFLLPDIMMIPEDGHSAYSQLANMTVDDNAMIIGRFDDNAMLNQFAALQEQYKKLTDASENPINNQCLKDFRRISNAIPKIDIQFFMLTGGTSAGLELKLSLDVKMSAWLKELFEWKPQKIFHPTMSEMPIVQFYAAIPTQILFKGIKSFQENIQKEPFACSALEFLNDIDIPQEFQSMSENIVHDQFIGYTAYEMANDAVPKSYAATWHADNLAQTASMLGFLDSETLKNSLNAIQNEPVDQDSGDMNNQLETANAENDSNESDDRESDEIHAKELDVISDAKLNFGENSNEYFKSPSYQVKSDRITVVSDKKFLDKLAQKPLKPASSLFHISVSERLTKELEDSDKSRDYQISADVSAAKSAIDITLRYAIE